MATIRTVSATSSYEQRARIAREADTRSDEVMAIVTASGFEIEWDDALSDLDDGVYERAVEIIEDDIRRDMRSDKFGDTITALAINGAGLAAWTQRQNEALAGFKKGTGPAPFSFREPALHAPTKAIEYWRKLLGLTDAQANQLASIDTRGEGAKIADRIATELIKRLQAIHDRTISEGLALGKFIEEVREIAPDASRSLLETEYRTHMATVYGEQLHEQITSRANAFPFTQFFAIIDNRTTDLICRPMGTAGPGGRGYIAASNDPIWIRWRTPAHWRCFVPETIVEGRFDVGTRMSYDGEVVELITRRGNRVTVTPNHPIATAAGLKPAGDLSEGDHVLSCDGDVERALSMGVAVQEENAPTRIDQVWRALLQRGNLHLISRTAKDDFHGDAIGGDGYVDVVAVDGKLLNKLHRQRAQDFGNLVFEVSLPAAVAHAAGGAVDDQRVGLPLAARGGPSLGALATNCATAALHSRPLQFLGFGSTAKFDAMCAEATNDGEGIGADFLGDLLRRSAGQVASRYFVVANLQDNAPAFDVDADLLQPSLHGLGVDPVLGGDVGLRHPGLVVSDEILRIHRKRYVGHVYDLRSSTGLIIANGIIASNCRSMHSPISYREAQRLGILANDGKTKIAIIGNNPERPFGDPPAFVTGPDGTLRAVKPQEGFGG